MTRIGVGYGLSGMSYRITATTEAGGRQTFVVKRESAENVERELLFRSHCEELVRGCIPECFAATHDGTSGCGVLILENVAPAEQGDVLRGCTGEQAEAVVRTQAQIHGATWKPSADAFAVDLPRWAPRPQEADVWSDLLARASGRFPAILTPARRARFHDLRRESRPASSSSERGRRRGSRSTRTSTTFSGDATGLRCSSTGRWPRSVPALDLVRCLVEGMATPSTVGPLLEAYADELRRQGVTAGDADDLRVAMGIVLPTLVQGAVGWAGREGLTRHARMADVCESFLRSVCAWGEAEGVGL